MSLKAGRMELKRGVKGEEFSIPRPYLLLIHLLTVITCGADTATRSGL